MSTRNDWSNELNQLRMAVHELDDRLNRILVNLDSKCGEATHSSEESLARELDELGEL